MPIPIETAISGAVCGSTFGILLQKSVSLAIHRREVKKLAPLLSLLQCGLCALRALTLVVQCVVPEINCQLLGQFGMTVYALWITCLDATLMLRSHAFLTFSHPLIRLGFKLITLAQILLSLGLQLYVASTAFAINKQGDTCIVLADFDKQNYTLANRCVLYLILLSPFVQQAFHAMRDTVGYTGRWVNLCINNALLALLIIGTEIVASIVSQINSLIPWLEAFFASVNCIEAMCLLQILEDTREKLSSKKSQFTSAGRM
ncbi:hypothetical protein EDD86DRAFT_248763 [Gorgonomyces haynaldii]|nr:hypothetical protein EDD86DRAFT_248763 [Gorgonomyces haynaldii]